MAGRAIWFVGLPGSGKSTMARRACEHYADLGRDVVLLQMDKQRKTYFPNPVYDEHERDIAYSRFVKEAVSFVSTGKTVFMDATAYKLSMRQQARNKIERFAEILIQCDVEEAMKREGQRPKGLVMADMYAKALERKRSGANFEGLGEVIGIDVMFEVNPDAELILDNTHLDVEQTAKQVIAFLDTWLDKA